MTAEEGNTQHRDDLAAGAVFVASVVAAVLFLL